MDNRAIGIMDSGLGGMSAVKVLRELLPNERLIYLGDTKNVPYGPRTPAEITRLSRACARWLMGQDIKCLVVACGTISCTALAALRRDCGIPVLGAIEPAAQEAAAATVNGRVGVIATQATVSSGAFPEAVRRINPETEFIEIPAPRLVTLVEAGRISPDDIETVAAVRSYLAPVSVAGCDTLILGCTHFPLLTPIFEAELEGAAVISSGGALARAAAELLHREGLECNGGAGDLDCCITGGDAATFARTAELFLGEALPHPVRTVATD